MLKLKAPFTARARLPFIFILTAAFLALCGFVSPVQLPVVIYKLLLCLLGGLCGYVMDVSAFPYAAPDSYLVKDWRKNPNADGGDSDADFPVLSDYVPAFLLAQVRRTAFVIGGMAVVGLGL